MDHDKINVGDIVQTSTGHFWKVVDKKNRTINYNHSYNGTTNKHNPILYSYEKKWFNLELVMANTLNKSIRPPSKTNCTADSYTLNKITKDWVIAEKTKHDELWYKLMEILND